MSTQRNQCNMRKSPMGSSVFYPDLAKTLFRDQFYPDHLGMDLPALQRHDTSPTLVQDGEVMLDMLDPVHGGSGLSHRLPCWVVKHYNPPHPHLLEHKRQGPIDAPFRLSPQRFISNMSKTSSASKSSTPRKKPPSLLVDKLEHCLAEAFQNRMSLRVKRSLAEAPLRDLVAPLFSRRAVSGIGLHFAML